MGLLQTSFLTIPSLALCCISLDRARAWVTPSNSGCELREAEYAMSFRFKHGQNMVKALWQEECQSTSIACEVIRMVAEFQLAHATRNSRGGGGLISINALTRSSEYKHWTDA
jgi:hypothetical protein